jgi:ABC-type transporter Mla subunit MlaD
MKTPEDAGWDAARSKRVLERSMSVLEKLVEQTDAFLDQWLNERDEAVSQTLGEVSVLAEELKAVFLENQTGTKTSIQSQYKTIRALTRSLEKIEQMVGANPFMAVRLANQLAAVSQRTISMGLTLEKEYGVLSSASRSSDFLEYLSDDQLAQVYAWAEDGKALKEVLGE